MRQILPLTIVASLSVLPAYAEEERGLTIMERGAQLFFEGLMKEMEPAIEEFSGFADQIGPAFRDFAEQMGPHLDTILKEVQDWSAYEAPEILPNGDIIIRRKPDATPVKPKETPPQIEL